MAIVFGLAAYGNAIAGLHLHACGGTFSRIIARHSFQISYKFLLINLSSI